MLRRKKIHQQITDIDNNNSKNNNHNLKFIIRHLRNAAQSALKQKHALSALYVWNIEYTKSRGDLQTVQNLYVEMWLNVKIKAFPESF